MEVAISVLGAATAVLGLISTVALYVLWRVKVENPGIIKASLSGGLAAPRQRAESDDGADAVDLSKPPAAAPPPAATTAAADGPRTGHAVIAAAGASALEKGPVEKKLGRPRRNSNADGAPAEDKLPDWEIDHRKLRFKYVIGKGNFGEVWLAAWLGSPVAVKTIVPELQSKEKLVKRFQDEIMLMSTLHHPNVVLFLGACTRKPHLCLVIEYCQHGSLHHFLKNEATHGIRVTMSLVLRFALDIARGVYYLHRRCSVVQRDLKARNILVDESLNAKVADFGLSRVLDEGEQNKLTACGTPAWTAPEIVKMEAYTDKVDVYSFGIIMWELITREEPYGGQKGVQIAYAAAEQGLRPEVPSFCPPDYAELMRQCWADDPADRPTFAVILKKLFQMKKACDTEASKALTDPGAKPFFVQPLPKYLPSNAGGAMIETKYGPKGVQAPPKAVERSASGQDRQGRRASDAQKAQQQPSPSSQPKSSPRTSIEPKGEVRLPGAVSQEDTEAQAQVMGRQRSASPQARPAGQAGVALDTASSRAQPRPSVANVEPVTTPVHAAQEGHEGVQAHVDRGLVHVRTPGTNPDGALDEWDGDVEDSDEEGQDGPGQRHSAGTGRDGRRGQSTSRGVASPSQSAKPPRPSQGPDEQVIQVIAVGGADPPPVL